MRIENQRGKRVSMKLMSDSGLVWLYLGRYDHHIGWYRCAKIESRGRVEEYETR